MLRMEQIYENVRRNTERTAHLGLHQTNGDEMNTKRYPRTLNEAFPHGPEYGCAVTGFARCKIANMALKFVIAVFAVPTLVAVLFDII